ncbi:L-type lectin-domain containing receptor kinase IX.1-like [Cryptomeria japonica]|uniref:L-type lectin-domain containing receptor kinase IX.1-like n=1 Tax=Cryptomeria japonica TaxID=3369 RepID=UPI0025AB6C1D|nr:L-type lectin-domain containing receptor kinase IX.1-like [Cryptomeria japonica]
MALISLHPLCFVVVFASIFVAQAGTVNFTFPPQDNLVKYNDTVFKDGAIDLTKNEYKSNLGSSIGWATYNEPIPMWDSSSQALANFTSHFQFRIQRHSSGGDGITFFIAPFDAEPPVNSSGKWLGLFNRIIDGNSSNQIVAVEFDTYKNNFDPDDNHVGIDVNSADSNETVSLNQTTGNWLASETLSNENKWDAWVDYDGGAKQIQVFLLYNPSGNTSNISKPGTPILSYKIDLSKFVPENVKVGLSASTGSASETHTIYSWNFSSKYSWEISTGNEGSVRVVLISVFASLFVLCCFIFVGVSWYRRKRMSGDEGREESDVELDEWFAQGPRKFSYAELSAATRNFSDDEKLGEGGFGGVYKGILPSTNESVAVKRISEGSKQGRKEYITEVTIISKLRHRNLVQLLGWCHQKGEFLLVYEFLPNGSLDNYLFEEQKVVMDWDRRYSIACDIASALVYLHEDWEQRVVHRDVKASNVLLDSDFNAKLGDFGLARLVGRDHAASHTTVVAGTYGYLAPECVYTGKASTESDVFSFGAVTLEIACGRRPVDRSLDKRLVEWVWNLYSQGRLLDSADKKLEGNFKGKEMERLLLLGLLCSHPDPKARPKMKEVVKILKFEAQLPNIPLNLPVAVYDSAILHSSSMPTGYGTSMTSTSSGITGTSVSSVSVSSPSTGSRTEVMSMPLLYHSEHHPSIGNGPRAEFMSM